MRFSLPAAFACAAMVLLAAASPRAGVLAATPIARSDLPWWQKRFEAKRAEIAHGRFDLVYYGDSITENFEGHALPAQAAAEGNWPAVWQRFYGDRHAINLGFKGDTTASLLWRVEHGEGDVVGLHGAPKLAVVLIGANNMGRLHWPAADTLAGIAADIDAIEAHLPHTRILLLSVLPSERSAWVDQTTRVVNAGLAARYGGGGRVVYVDVGHVLMRGNGIDRSLFIDPLLVPPDPPLHPTASGATRIAEVIEPIIAGVLGDRRH